MFALGVLAWPRDWFTRIRSGSWWRLLTVAVLGLGVAWRKPIDEESLGGWNLDAFLTTVGYITFGCLLVAALLVLFRDHANGTGPRRRWMAQHAYLAYLLQGPVLVAVAVSMRWLAAPSILKALLLSMVAVPACWFCARALRTIAAVRRVC